MIIYIESRVCEELKIPYNEKRVDENKNPIKPKDYLVQKEDLEHAWYKYARDIYRISWRDPVSNTSGSKRFDKWIARKDPVIKLKNKGGGYFEIL